MATTDNGGVVTAGRKMNRALGISAEPQSLKNLQELTTTKFPEFKKEDKSRNLIRSAIMDNDFMKNLEPAQIAEIVDCMYPISAEFKKEDKSRNLIRSAIMDLIKFLDL